jgi:hypothetical protein
MLIHLVEYLDVYFLWLFTFSLISNFNLLFRELGPDKVDQTCEEGTGKSTNG